MTAAQPLVIRDDDGVMLVIWNGILKGGVRASPGVYIASVQSQDDLGATTVSLLSFTVFWEDGSGDLSLNLVPNPAIGSEVSLREVRLQCPAGFRGWVRIYSLSGEQVWSSPVIVTGVSAVPVQGRVAAGVYLVLIQGADGEGRPVRLLRHWVIL